MQDDYTPLQEPLLTTTATRLASSPLDNDLDVTLLRVLFVHTRSIGSELIAVFYRLISTLNTEVLLVSFLRNSLSCCESFLCDGTTDLTVFQFFCFHCVLDHISGPFRGLRRTT